MIRKVQQRAQQVISGFRSPADDYLEGRLDISDMLVVDPHCTFYFKMASNCMVSYGLQEGALLIVDKSLSPVGNSIVITTLQDELVCRSLEYEGKQPKLVCDHDEVKPSIETGLEIWGVVIAVCFGVLPKALRKGKYSHVCTL